MSSLRNRVFAPGCDLGLRAALGEELGVQVEVELPADFIAGDLVVLDADAGRPDGQMNAFSTCRVIKREPRTRVFIVLKADDPFGEEIARFCMADGVLHRRGELVVGIERLAVFVGEGGRARPSVETLLDRYEARIQDDPERAVSALQRLGSEIDSGSVTSRFSDPETGLYDGAFAGFKLDEELKRAVRFHQPLAMLLLDCGIAHWPANDSERRTVLAEVASVFLEECRDIDVLARFSPTVFLILLPGTGPDGALILARRLVGSLGEREFSADIRLRPSVGIAIAPHPRVQDRKSFVTRAEKALDRAAGQPGHVAVADPD